MPKHPFCQLSVGSHPSHTSEDLVADRASDGVGAQTSGRNRMKMMMLVDAESHGNDRGSKDANKTPKTLDVRANANKTPKDTTVHLVRENETIKKNVSKGLTDANVHSTKPPLLGRPSGSHYKVGPPPRRPRKPVWLEILCNLFTVRMFISSRCA